MSDAQNKESGTQASASVELKVPTPETTEATLEQSIDPPDDHKKCGPPPGKECDESKKCDKPCDEPEAKCDKPCDKPCDEKCDKPCDKPCDEKCDKPCDKPCDEPEAKCDKARCGDYGAVEPCCDGKCDNCQCNDGQGCGCGGNATEPCEDNGDEKCDTECENQCGKIELLKDRVPRNVQSSLAPLSRDLEDVCAQVTTLVHTYFNQPENKQEFGLLIIKVMEFVEDYRDLTGEEKKLVATRCIIEQLDETKEVPREVTNDLMTTVPGVIEAVIKLSKGEPLNRTVTGAGIVESAYVVKRAFERTVEYIRDHKYEIADFMGNVFFIASQIMFIVGGFPALAGIQKKAIVIEVFTKIITEFTDSGGNALEQHFIDATLEALPAMIDTLVNVAEGKIHINDLVKCCAPFFACCKSQ